MEATIVLTPVEERVLRWEERSYGTKPDICRAHRENQKWLAGFRRDLRGIAYHEAGHAVVAVFLGRTSRHILYLSIIPKAKNRGSVRFERCPDRSIEYVRCLEKRLGTVAAWTNMLTRLAGWCAGEIAFGQQADADAFFCELDHAWGDPALWDDARDRPLAGTDFGRVWDNAEYLASRPWPRDRIMTQALAWTLEILAVPEVWGTVETVAGDLLSRGTIRRGARMDRILSPALGLWQKPPHRQKWRRRLMARPENSPQEVGG